MDILYFISECAFLKINVHVQFAVFFAVSHYEAQYFFFPAVVQQVSPSCKGTAVLWTAPPEASLIERCKEEPFTHEHPITEQRTCCCPIRRQDGPETTRLFSYIFFHMCALSLDCQVELPSRLHNKLCSFNNNICREWVWALCANRCLKRLA